jgi:sporulation protein YlmC with PRC-barrel domain
MRKFENVDIIAALAAVVERNTKHYKTDFEYDKEMFVSAAESKESGDKTMLWLSRESGTQCVQEREAFISGSEGYFSWTYYQGRRNIAAFAVEIAYIEDGKPVGTLYELDFDRHAERVNRVALPITDVRLTFENGNAERFPYEKIKGNWTRIQDQYGRITDRRYEVADEGALQALLRQESAERSKYPARSFAAYLQKLAAPAKPSALQKLHEAQKAVQPPHEKAPAKAEPER